MRRGLLTLGAWVLTAATAWAQAPVAVEYYHLDAVGSVRAITDAARTAVVFDYAPFGDGGVGGGASPAAVRFAGKERDAETGLDYFGARYYGSRAGRFTTLDPVLDVEQALVNPQRWNRYAYSFNNPLTFTDPDGRNPVLAAAALAWAAYEVGSTIYDAYQAITTIRDPTASTNEKLLTTGLFLAGALPGVPGGATAARSVIRAEGVAEVAETGFRSFSAFKRAFGAAGEGAEWHHIVEQTGSNVARFSGDAIHSTENIVRLPTDIHRKISAYYSSKQTFTNGLTVREWLRTQSLDEQRRFGLGVLEAFGVNIAK